MPSHIPKYNSRWAWSLGREIESKWGWVPWRCGAWVCSRMQDDFKSTKNPSTTYSENTPHTQTWQDGHHAAQGRPWQTTSQEEERGSTGEPRGDWSCLPLPGGWKTAHLRSSSGHGFWRKDFKPITCVSILSKDIDEDVSISPCTNDITSVQLDFILVTWRWRQRKSQLIQVLSREEQRPK